MVDNDTSGKAKMLIAGQLQSFGTVDHCWSSFFSTFLHPKPFPFNRASVNWGNTMVDTTRWCCRVVFVCVFLRDIIISIMGTGPAVTVVAFSCVECSPSPDSV